MGEVIKPIQKNSLVDPPEYKHLNIVPSGLSLLVDDSCSSSRIMRGSTNKPPVLVQNMCVIKALLSALITPTCPFPSMARISGILLCITVKPFH